MLRLYYQKMLFKFCRDTDLYGDEIIKKNKFEQMDEENEDLAIQK